MALLRFRGFVILSLLTSRSTRTRQFYRAEPDFMLVFAARILEGLFVVGMFGCAIVLVLTAIEDVRTLFGFDEHE